MRLAQNIVAKTASGVKLLGVNYPTLFQPDVVLKHSVEFQWFVAWSKDSYRQVVEWKPKLINH